MLDKIKKSLPVIAIGSTLVLTAIFYVPFQINGIDVIKDKQNEYWAIVGYGNKASLRTIPTTFKIKSRNSEEVCSKTRPFDFKNGRHIFEGKVEILLGDDCFKKMMVEDSSWEFSMFADKKGLTFPNEILKVKVNFKK